MCWLVKTRFCIGIWLHNPVNDQNSYLKNASFIYMESYEDAINEVKREGGDNVDLNHFKPNRLYQIRDKRIYTIFYNRRKVGFVETDKIAEFLQKNHIKEQFFHKRYNVDYATAVAAVTGLGADTGRTSIVLHKVPVCGFLYNKL